MSVSGVKLRWFWRAMNLSILLLVHIALTSCSPKAVVAAHEADQITVKITNLSPKAGRAIARVEETHETASLKEDKLVLSACARGQHISVWAPGYYIKSLSCNGKVRHDYSIELEPIKAIDDPNYAWITADNRLDATRGCARCHTILPDLNEYVEWEVDGHSRAFTSPYFWTTYMGTDIHRAAGQKTIWGFSPDGSRYRLPPDPNQPDYGPGYRLDYPDASGNCGFCHVPAAMGAAQQEADLAPLIQASLGDRASVASEGVTCDICHKVIDISLNEKNLPYEDHPGILSFSFLRPTSESHFVTGPGAHLEISAIENKRTCVPLFSESSFCAPCHYAKFSGVEIYSSYKEWLNSPYSQPNQSYRSCQDCHMQSLEEVGERNPARSACSAQESAFQNFSHNMMKRDNTGKSLLIEGAATVEVKASKEDGKIKVNVVAVNTRAGHKLPTDSPLRHLILVVEARDVNDQLLTQVDGPRIPEWGGSDGQINDYAGKPGVIYANILKDKDTNTVPAVDYWNPTAAAWEGSDNRLIPYKDALSQYFFVAPSHGMVTITANLIYRSAFIEIARQKRWTLQDILVNWDSATIEE